MIDFNDPASIMAWFLQNPKRHGPQLAVQGHAVLCLALDFEIGGHVLCGLGHAVHAVLRLHQFIRKTPANGGVVDRVGS